MSRKLTGYVFQLTEEKGGKVRVRVFFHRFVFLRENSEPNPRETTWVEKESPLQKKNRRWMKHRLFSSIIPFCFLTPFLSFNSLLKLLHLNFELIRNDTDHKRSLVYSKILRSYNDLRIPTNALEDAKSRILRYNLVVAPSFGNRKKSNRVVENNT